MNPAWCVKESGVLEMWALLSCGAVGKLLSFDLSIAG